MRKPKPPIDTPAKVTQAREALGLNKAELARELRLGADAGRETVRRWENGTGGIPGPVQVALELMLTTRKARQ